MSERERRKEGNHERVFHVYGDFKEFLGTTIRNASNVVSPFSAHNRAVTSFLCPQYTVPLSGVTTVS